MSESGDKPLRKKMPRTTEFLDACAAAWGGKAVSAIIRAGIDGQPVFYAREAGVEIGTPQSQPAGRYAADYLRAVAPRKMK